jgi:protein-S-isoprenylcysteine O-methyltransferase Ste14
MVVRRSAAAAGTVSFFVLAPGVVAGVVPWWLTGWRPGAPLSIWWPLRLAGALLVIAGAAVLVHAFARFVTEGLGTPAPVAPTSHLVVGGLYRYVRNPMYLAVTGTILGQGLLLWRAILLAYAAIVAAAFVAFVLGYEQPMLRRQFGPSYEAYRRGVRAWWPRLHAWNPEQDAGA